MLKRINLKEQYFEKVYPHLWNQYTFLNNERRRYEEKFSFLIAFVGIILIVYFQLFTSKLSEGIESGFYVPLFFFLIPLILSFYHAIPKQIWIPWVSAEELKQVYLSNKKFYEKVIRSIYGTIPHLEAYRKSKSLIYDLCILSLFLGFFFIVAAILSEQSIFWNVIGIITTIVILIFIFKQYNKPYLKSSPAPEVEKFFDSF